MEHRIEIPISNGHADISFFEDMIRVNFPDFTLNCDTMRVFNPTLDLFVTEFAYDADLLLWITWLISNAYNFHYTFIA